MRAKFINEILRGKESGIAALGIGKANYIYSFYALAKKLCPESFNYISPIAGTSEFFTELSEDLEPNENEEPTQLTIINTQHILDQVSTLLDAPLNKIYAITQYEQGPDMGYGRNPLELMFALSNSVFSGFVCDEFYDLEDEIEGSIELVERHMNTPKLKIKIPVKGYSMEYLSELKTVDLCTTSEFRREVVIVFFTK